eukprot:6469145-Amphidinium_carterae.1
MIEHRSSRRLWKLPRNWLVFTPASPLAILASLAVGMLLQDQPPEEDESNLHMGTGLDGVLGELATAVSNGRVARARIFTPHPQLR